MKASDALALTQSALTDGQVMTELRNHVNGLIRLKAEKGERSFSHPLQHYPMMVSNAQKEALWQALRKDGYTVIHRPDYGQREPGYTEIKW